MLLSFYFWLFLPNCLPVLFPLYSRILFISKWSIAEDILCNLNLNDAQSFQLHVPYLYFHKYAVSEVIFISYFGTECAKTPEEHQKH